MRVSRTGEIYWRKRAAKPQHQVIYSPNKSLLIYTVYNMYIIRCISYTHIIYVIYFRATKPQHQVIYSPNKSLLIYTVYNMYIIRCISYTHIIYVIYFRATKPQHQVIYSPNKSLLIYIFYDMCYHISYVIHFRTAIPQHQVICSPKKSLLIYTVYNICYDISYMLYSSGQSSFNTRWYTHLIYYVYLYNKNQNTLWNLFFIYSSNIWKFWIDFECRGKSCALWSQLAGWDLWLEIDL